MTTASSSTRGSAIPPHHVLIAGGDSTIGSALNKRLLAEGYQVTCSTRRSGNHGENNIYLDLEEPASFLSIDNRRFDTAILCGAVASVQKCQEKPKQTRKINVDGTLALASLLRDCGSHLIFLSTNMVFDGTKQNAQASDSRNPLTEYGRQKAEVEEALLTASYPASIVRLGKVLPRNYPLFREWLKCLRAGRNIYPYSDRNMAPISLAFATDILMWLVSCKCIGIFQATASHDITYANAAYKLATFTHADLSLIRPIQDPRSNAKPGIKLPTPAYTCLDFSPEFKQVFTVPSPEQALHYAFQ